MIRPFIRWAGGKSKIISNLLEYVPHEYGRYWEPFLGAGSMFFALKPEFSILSDLNDHLISCYKIVKDHPEKIYKLLKEYSSKTSESYYYKMRDKYNNTLSLSNPIEHAALFIYLNKTCFNGIFRVNTKGKFNVPYGYKKTPAIPSKDLLMEISNSLGGAELLSGSFEKILLAAKKKDFIYLDPPYPPINGTSFFTHYTKERFDKNDQRKVAEIAGYLGSRGCKVMISNAETDLIMSLYKGWKIISLPVTRWITCKKHKHKVNEVVILNY